MKYSDQISFRQIVSKAAYDVVSDVTSVSSDGRLRFCESLFVMQFSLTEAALFTNVSCVQQALKSRNVYLGTIEFLAKSIEKAEEEKHDTGGLPLNCHYDMGNAFHNLA